VLDQGDEPAHRGVTLTASVGQVQGRGQLRRRGERAVDDALGLQPAHRLRHQRHPEPGGDEAQGRQHARRLLADLRAEPGTVAGGNDCIVQAGPDRTAVEDECLAREGGERQRLRRGAKRMAARQRRDHRLVEQRADREIVARADRGANKGDVERLRPQRRDQLDGAAFLERQRNQRMRFAKGADRPRHEWVERRRAGETEADTPGFAARRLSRRRDRVADAGENRLGLVEEGAARRG
jgi:hypothetical protein